MSHRKEDAASVDLDVTPTPLVSVVIPVYNNAPGLRAVVDCLRLQSYPADRREIIVVDNGSSDETACLRSRHPEVVWLHEPHPGSYRARNAGVEAAHGQVLAFTDADCLPDQDWLAQGVAALQRAPGADVVAGRIDVLFEDSRRPGVCEIYDSLCSFQQEETLRRFRYGATANLFTTTQVTDRVGPFDEQLRSGGDCEWCNRVSDAGLRLIYCDEAVVRHPARRSLSSIAAKSLRVTIGTMTTAETRGRSRSGPRYLAYHALARPRRMLSALNRFEPPLDAFKKLGVLALYFAIKVAQFVERVRVAAGGVPRR